MLNYKQIYFILVIVLSILACREEIDKSNRYVFTGETVADYMLNRSEKYSHMITLMKRAGLFGLLQTYGQYTLFLPDNAAVERYLREQDSIYWATKDSPIFVNTGITSPDIEELSDSMAVIIARSHLLNLAYHTADMGEGALPTRNFNNRYLGINYDVVGEKFYIMVNNKSAIIDGDNEVENGIIHIVDKAINPVEMNVPQLIASCNFFSIFNEALNVTGFKDSLALDLDMSYIWDPTATAGVGTPSYYPKLKYHKYTGFIETDDVFNTNGIYALADLKVFAEKWYGTEDRDNTQSPRNALHKFVSYHFLNREIPYNGIVYHGISAPNIFDPEDVMLPNTDRYDYYETMQGRLMKVIKPLSTPDGLNIYINYSKRALPYNIAMRPHVNVRIIPMTEFVHSDEKYAKFDQMAANGTIHPIDKILIYNEDEMVGNILNERIRIDIASLLPELSSNGLRYLGYNEDGTFLAIPDGYSSNMKVRGGLVQYLSIEHCYCRDYMIFNGQYDVSLRIPPMPARTYEIRFGYKNQGSSNGGESDNKNQGMSMVQVYIDGKVASRAEDFGISNLHIRKGAVPDEQTYDNGVENDKLMRNLGYLKAPDCYYVYTGNKKIVARESARHTRCIVARQHWSEKEHWIRFRSVGNRLQALLLDYIELVPLNIINDPTKPEDRH
ncbi:MAG: fasciclin domain-containing protein [Bacteroidaceae bacterium]|nr:fasciclin domain-containing protein [Bacteroidaceae bacterium]